MTNTDTAEQGAAVRSWLGIQGCSWVTMSPPVELSACWGSGRFEGHDFTQGSTRRGGLTVRANGASGSREWCEPAWEKSLPLSVRTLRGLRAAPRRQKDTLTRVPCCQFHRHHVVRGPRFTHPRQASHPQLLDPGPLHSGCADRKNRTMTSHRSRPAGLYRGD
jgi:hypothetical protein